MTTATVRRAEASDRIQLTDALASAFALDPMFQWVAGVDADTSVESKLHPFFAAMVKLVFGRDDHLVFTTDDGAGAAVWMPPNRWKMSTTDMVRALPAMMRTFGTKVPRMIGAFNAVEKVHPAEEHYFLEAIGTRADAQGGGVGTTVITPMLDRCDAEGMPAYLESSNLRNVPFYRRHGFEETGRIDIGTGAPPITAM